MTVQSYTQQKRHRSWPDTQSNKSFIRKHMALCTDLSLLRYVCIYSELTICFRPFQKNNSWDLKAASGCGVMIAKYGKDCIGESS